MAQHLKKIIYCSVFEKLAANFENKKACTAIIGVNLAAIHILLKGDHVFSALLLSKPLGRGSACISVVFNAYMWPFSLTSSLHRGKRATGFGFVCLLLKPGSHMSVLATSCFLTDHKVSLCSSSSSCHWCLLRHHHLGHEAVEDQFCSSTSRKQLEEENGGTPYSRSSGGSHETGRSCRSQWCCHVCFQLSLRGLPRHMDMRWPAVFVDQRKKSCGLCVCQ